jgi:rhodanese-related sulfurtransferase
LVVSKGASDVVWMRCGSWADQALSLGAVGLLMAPLMIRARRGARSPIAGFAAIPLVAVASAVLWHSVHENGFLGHREALAQVELKHFDPALPEIGAEEVVALLDRQDVTIIDARLPDSYDLGHLRNAVNLPVSSGLSERRRILTDIPKTRRIVVYCQSKTCPYAEAVASDLAFRGYEHIVLFPEGWRGWIAHERSKREP